MLILIGNAPSSGSSFFADLLDGVRCSACGEELGIFANKRIYRFPSFKQNVLQPSKSSCLYVTSSGLFVNQLHSYGLNIAKFRKLCAQAGTTNEFVGALISYYKSLRGKKEDAIIFEKTPQNTSCIGEFLDAFPNSFFIHVVRNPIYVFSSLLRRGFPPYIAIGTWLIDVASYLRFKDRDRVILLKYEDLVSNPFRISADLLKKISRNEISEEELETGYRKNRYREIHAIRMSTWTINQYGRIGNANKKKMSHEEMKLFSRIFNVKVSDKYAELFNIEPVSFIDAARQLGYLSELEREIVETDKTPGKTRRDVRKLLSKLVSDLRRGEATLLDMDAYLSPLKRC